MTTPQTEYTPQNPAPNFAGLNPQTGKIDPCYWAPHRQLGRQLGTGLNSARMYMGVSQGTYNWNGYSEKDDKMSSFDEEHGTLDWGCGLALKINVKRSQT